MCWFVMLVQASSLTLQSGTFLASQMYETKNRPLLTKLGWKANDRRPVSGLLLSTRGVRSSHVPTSLAGLPEPTRGMAMRDIFPACVATTARLLVPG